MTNEDFLKAKQIKQDLKTLKDLTIRFNNKCWCFKGIN